MTPCELIAHRSRIRCARNDSDILPDHDHRLRIHRHGWGGLEFAGVAPVSAPGASDLVLRNDNSGAFQVYNIANNQLTGSAPLGTVGLDWQLPQSPSGLPGGGFAPSSPTGLVQAIAGFGGGSGAGESVNAIH